MSASNTQGPTSDIQKIADYVAVWRRQVVARALRAREGGGTVFNVERPTPNAQVAQT